MLPPMDTSVTWGQADTADWCELANGPGADKVAPLQASYDRAAELIAEMTVDIRSTLQYLTYLLIA